MSLYSHGLQLLPRPSRSVFSVGSEVTRATLPDLASVEELRTFVRRTLVLEYAVPSYFAQLYLCVAIVCVLIAVVVMVVLARMYDSSFWLLRKIKRPSGTLIVPNALLAFTVAEGVYAILFVVYSVQQHLWFKAHARLPHGFMMWLCVTWIPLCIGPVLAVWGTYHAAATLAYSPALEVADNDDQEETKQGRCMRRCSRTLWSNLLGVGVPLLVLLSVVLPAARAEWHNKQAIRQQQRWLAEYAEKTVFTQAMVRDAQLVWFTFLKGCWIASALFAVWTTYASLLGIAYLFVSVRLISCVRREIVKSNGDSSHRLRVTVDQTAVQRRRVAEVMHDVDVLMRNLPTSSNENDGVTSRASSAHSLTSIMRNSSSAIVNRSRTATVSTSRASVLFAQARSYIPELFVTENAEDDEHHKDERCDTPAPSERAEQLAKLRKAYHHIIVQVAAIAPGCFLFAGLACWASLQTYSSTEQPYPGGGTYGQRAMPVILLGANWATVIIGCTTFLAVAHRTYEPLLRRGTHRQSERRDG